MRHLMNPLDFSVEELDKLFALADDIEQDPRHLLLRAQHPHTLKL